MNLLPVIHREIRVQARQSFTYWGRVIAMGVMLAVACYFAATRGLSPQEGDELFSWLHRVLLLLTWTVVPLMTADAISRERREGTLGLLFLTPLKAWDIVLAKTVAHALRAFGMCVAVLPVMAIPFLAGGVSWVEAMLSAAFILTSVLWAVGAGLLASSASKQWLRSLIWATLVAAVLFVGFMMMHVLAMALVISKFLPGGRPEPFFLIFVAAAAYAVNFEGFWGWLAGQLPVTAQSQWVLVAAVVNFVSIAVVVLITALAARNVRRFWQDKPPSALQRWVEAKFCTPVIWRGFFRKWMRWKLERNPIGWLEQRTWSARLVTWSWLAVLVSIYSVALGERSFYYHHFDSVHGILSTMLLASIAATAAGSFRRERDSGVLQLLLVAPLSVSQLIWGRLRGLWGQFLPATVLLFGVWLYLAEAFNMFANLYNDFDWQERLQSVLFCVSSYATLPVVGLYFSLCTRHFVTALVWTAVISILLPFGLAAFFQIFVRWVATAPLYVLRVEEGSLFILAAALQVIASIVVGRLLQINLERRSFILA